jgi:mevalonate kinase
MMQFNLTVPSKTFLLGEYLVLKGGPAILLATPPPFYLNVFPVSSQSGSGSNIHPDSPAGRWLQKWKQFYSDYSFHFIDPHAGLGGFGASSAQFVMLYGFMQHVLGETIDAWKMVQEFQTCAWHGRGTIPSGADVMTQLKGDVTLFHPAAQETRNVSWPFPDLEYGIVRTGHKLATHKHLETLDEFDPSPFSTIVKEAYQSIESRDSGRFMDTFKRYGLELKKQGLVFQETEKFLNQLRLCPEIQACKGCGALGVDVIVILFYKENRLKVLRWMTQHELQLVVYGQEIAQGLVVQTRSLIS